MRLMSNVRARWMVGSALLGIALLGVTVRAHAGENESSSTENESISTAPNFTGEDLDGKSYQLSDYLAKGPVFLDFWTTWCKPCLLELPELAKVQEKYKDRFTLLTVASDDGKTASKVKPLAMQRNFHFPVLLDSKRTIGNQYNVRQYPTSFLIAPNGKIASVHIGYKPGDEKAIEEEILKLLSESAPAEESGEGGEH